MSFLLYRGTGDGVSDCFLKISDYFSKISKNSPNLSDDHTNKAKHFRSKLKISKDYRLLRKIH